MKPSPHLMIPGPTPLPESARAAMARPAIGHRSEAFYDVLKRVFPNIKQVFQTRNPVFVYTASGTAAMEGAYTNTLNRGDRVLVLCCGVFSERWARMGNMLGFDVTELSVEPGQPNTVASLKEALETAATKGTPYKAVVVTHSETSTGVLNPIEAMLPLIHEHGALSYVDAVTSLGASPFNTDELQADLVFSGSQKGFMTPPGLSFLAVSDRAMKAHESVEYPGFYFNFANHKKYQDNFQTTCTPNTHGFMALDEALQLMLAEGIDHVTARHRRMRNMIRDGVRELGMSLVVEDDQFASDAVTSVYPPEGLTVPEIRGRLKDQYNIIVANGQRHLKDKLFRIGHLGFQTERDVIMVFQAMKQITQNTGSASHSTCTV